MKPVFDIDSLDYDEIEREISRFLKKNRGEVERIADAMIMLYGNFTAKANPNRHDVHFTFVELQRFAAITGHIRVLELVVEPFGFVLCKTTAVDSDFLTLHLKAKSEYADVDREVSMAIGDDRKIDVDEAKRILKEKLEARRADDDEIAFLKQVVESGEAVSI